MQEKGVETAYCTVFSVKGDWNKVADHSRGWVNLAGMKATIHKEEGEEAGTSDEGEYL